MVILFDMYNVPDDVFELVFATEQQVIVGRMLMDELKAHGGDMGKTEMSLFASRLHDGCEVELSVPAGPVKTRKKMKISYNKRQFYDRILTPMKGMGMIHYDMYNKRYRLSDSFNKAMQKVGLMWLKEVNRPASHS